MFTLFSHTFSFAVYFHYPEDLPSQDRKLTRFSLFSSNNETRKEEWYGNILSGPFPSAEGFHCNKYSTDVLN